MLLPHIPFPLLPSPPSWYPGHMAKFTKMLPALLSRTDVVLELRDSRLPLTSINGKLEGACMSPSSNPRRHGGIITLLFFFLCRFYLYKKNRIVSGSRFDRRVFYLQDHSTDGGLSVGVPIPAHRLPRTAAAATADSSANASSFSTNATWFRNGVWR